MRTVGLVVGLFAACALGTATGGDQIIKLLQEVRQQVMDECNEGEKVYRAFDKQNSLMQTSTEGEIEDAKEEITQQSATEKENEGRMEKCEGKMDESRSTIDDKEAALKSDLAALNKEIANLERQIMENAEAITNIGEGIEGIAAIDSKDAAMEQVSNMLHDFRDTLRSDKTEAEKALASAKSDKALKTQSANDIIANQNKKIETQQAIHSDSQSQLATATQERENAEDYEKEQRDKLNRLKSVHDRKTSEFEHDDKTCQTEIAAFDAAIADLKKHAFLQQKSFLQVDAGSPTAESVKMTAFLTQRAAALKSANLAQVVTQAMATGPFDKVVDMIDKMIQRLQDEGGDEAEQDGQCKKDIAENKQKRGNLEEDIAKLNALQNREDAKAEKADARQKKESRLLVKLNKEKKTEIELFEKSKAALTKRQKTCQTSLDDINSAMNALEKMQAETGSDFKDVIDAVSTIQSDMQTCVSDCKQTLKDEKEDHEDEKHRLDTEIQSATSNKKNAKANMNSAKDKYQSAKGDKAAANSQLESATTEWDALKKSCIDSNESHEQRMQKRQAEIDSLKEALEILRNSGK